MILRFLIKAVGYVFGLIMRLWRGAARLGSAPRWKKGEAPLAELLIRDTPGASSKISLLFRHFPPSPSPSTMCRFSQCAAPCSSRTCLTNTAAKHPCPPPASIHPILLRHRRKITATFFRCEVHSFIFVNRDEVCQ